MSQIPQIYQLPKVTPFTIATVRENANPIPLTPDSLICGAESTLMPLPAAKLEKFKYKFPRKLHG